MREFGLKALAIAAILTVAAPANVATAATSVNPIGLPVVAGEFAPVGVSYSGQRVTAKGAWLRDATYLTIDRATAVSTTLAADWQYGAESGLVGDNPSLFVQIEPSDIYHFAGAWLLNTTTGVRARIDTASDGTALVPAWSGTCDEECGQTGTPGVQVGPESVSRDGSLVAFCANYTSATVFDLYLKNMTTGALTVRPGLCGAGGPAEMRTAESYRVFAPEVSHTGSVVHLRGTLDPEEGHFYPDSLLFPASGGLRRINGQGSMTRDGGTVFMRVGSYRFGDPEPTRERVAAYNVKSRTTRMLPGRDEIYGSNALHEFSASVRSSMRGRYVVYGDRLAVIDRRTGRRYNVAMIMATHGYAPPELTDWDPLISGDGRTLITRSGDQYVAVRLF